MKYYRALKDLSNGYKRYEVAPESAFKAAVIPILLAKGAIGELTGPPLSKLPGWKVRAEKLAPMGIVFVHEFLSADVKRIAEVVSVRESTVEKWQKDIVHWLQPVPAAALAAPRRRR